ncbi:phosphatase PAP2 family protein [Marinomonas algicola]|uniref:phosphatase PAP2 family protein n=1 Tax=Marinomonas algicola TaxID=2773454 RepID=UPI001748A5E3|nr:phosphatase PAP2 family protein [Marinomonas algicola]
MAVLKQIHHLDVLAFCWCMARKRRAFLANISRCISFTADGPIYLFITFLLFFYGQSQWVVLLLCSFAIERGIYFIAKNGFKRSRPAEALDDFKSFIRPADHFSFPSGHTSGAFLMAYFLSEWLPGLNLCWYFWALNVALSRVFLGVHFPTDTLVGALLGSGCAFIVVEGVVG